ncbi:peptide deformylase [Singulisphaera acidiphila]|uniref:Peptide deformylase n=1 Tax=Singulisphaera acidiphila (strain ATCC BAA-1392 / DSM 18658 / VKM B-2454 / MOB10) TaxID=886293 RepID=L0D8Z4_SINAD|nr:peptide deformylase [Singulisphaera acidiphila]AGA25712.1 peptide deformylase [Singulisphaera acidiphila DSM 18658]
MIRPIVQLGDPVLKAKARRLDAKEIANETTQTLVRDMLETLEDSGGVGLAAPQVGVSVALILAGSFPTEHSPDRPEVEVTALVNPRIVWSSVETESAWEGCLSFLDYRVQVVRPLAIQVEYDTLDGTAVRLEATGFFARVLQHEIDHLEGILTLDRAASPEDIERLEPNPAS